MSSLHHRAEAFDDVHLNLNIERHPNGASSANFSYRCYKQSALKSLLWPQEPWRWVMWRDEVMPLCASIGRGGYRSTAVVAASSTC